MSAIRRSIADGLALAARPLARALLRGRVTPNMLATAALLTAGGAAVAFAAGRVRLGGALLLVAATAGLLGGEVEHEEGMATTFGAFYGSTVERLGEVAVFSGVGLFFLQGGVPPTRLTPAVVTTLAAMAASQLASYMRARAEALGLDCSVGIARSHERLIALGAAALTFGPGAEGRSLVWMMALLVVVTTITVVQRAIHVTRTTRGVGGRPARSRATLPGHAPALRKGR